MEGTNAIEARGLLENSPLEFLVASTFDEAARMAVNAAKGGQA